jgi:DNA polymerase-3 subunit delta'
MRTVGPPPHIRREAAPVREVLSLEEIIGQERAVGILRAAISSGRVHHAWILSGPPGVGKFTTALAFAAVLLDPTTAPDLSGNAAPDPESEVQRLIQAGTHPDLHIITKELAAVSREDNVRDGKQTNIAKAVLEEFLLEPAAKTRVMTGRSAAGKVFIVDEAELIDDRGQNALLKTLEEPPEGTVIILVTPREHRLLSTIRSRCQRVAFGTLSEAEMGKWLKRRAGAGGAIETAKVKWLLKFAAGSPGVAAMVIENDLFGWRERLEPMLEQVEAGEFPVEMGKAMAELVDERAAAAVRKNPDASKDGANKTWARRMLAFLAEHTRQGLARAAGKDEAGARRRLHMLEAIARAEEELGANVSLALVMENLAVQMSAEPAPV